MFIPFDLASSFNLVFTRSSIVRVLSTFFFFTVLFYFFGILLHGPLFSSNILISFSVIANCLIPISLISLRIGSILPLRDLASFSLLNYLAKSIDILSSRSIFLLDVRSYLFFLWLRLSVFRFTLFVLLGDSGINFLKAELE